MDISMLGMKLGLEAPLVRSVVGEIDRSLCGDRFASPSSSDFVERRGIGERRCWCWTSTPDFEGL
jgi:hypothetical protein